MKLTLCLKLDSSMNDISKLTIDSKSELCRTYETNGALKLFVDDTGNLWNLCHFRHMLIWNFDLSWSNWAWWVITHFRVKNTTDNGQGLCCESVGTAVVSFTVFSYFVDTKAIMYLKRQNCRFQRQSILNSNGPKWKLRLDLKGWFRL